MKMAKEQEKPQKDKKEKAGSKRKGLAAGLASGEFTEAEETLFDRLRALRMEIAREEKVPPYIVFSDKTLVHMCFVKPKTKTEMLGVTGVGEFKFENTARDFLHVCHPRTRGGTMILNTGSRTDIPAYYSQWFTGGWRRDICSPEIHTTRFR